MEKQLNDLLWYAIKNLEQMRYEMKSRGDFRKVNSLYKSLYEKETKIYNSEKTLEVTHNAILEKEN